MSSRQRENGLRKCGRGEGGFAPLALACLDSFPSLLLVWLLSLFPGLPRNPLARFGVGLWGLCLAGGMADV